MTHILHYLIDKSLYQWVTYLKIRSSYFAVTNNNKKFCFVSFSIYFSIYSKVSIFVDIYHSPFAIQCIHSIMPWHGIQSIHRNVINSFFFLCSILLCHFPCYSVIVAISGLQSNSQFNQISNACQ